MRVILTTKAGKSIRLNPAELGRRLLHRANKRMDDQGFLKLVQLLFLLLYFRDLFVVRYPPLAAVGGISLLFSALLFPRLLGRTGYWLLLLVPNAWMILKHPYYASNHSMLELCMILAFLIGSRMRDARNRILYLQTISKFLLSLVMVSSVVHKLLSSSFVNGQFFYFRWLTDTLLHDGINTLFFGDYKAMAEGNRRLLESYISTPSPSVAFAFESPMDLLVLFQFLAIAVVLIEVLIPILCLTSWAEKARHVVILPFVIATSLFTPEYTFLTLVALIGMIQTGKNESRTRWLYVGVIVLMNAYAYAFVWPLEMSPGPGQ